LRRTARTRGAISRGWIPSTAPTRIYPRPPNSPDPSAPCPERRSCGAGPAASWRERRKTDSARRYRASSSPRSGIAASAHSLTRASRATCRADAGSSRSSSACPYSARHNAGRSPGCRPGCPWQNHEPYRSYPNQASEPRASRRRCSQQAPSATHRGPERLPDVTTGRTTTTRIPDRDCSRPDRHPEPGHRARTRR
jgi:hypothetical protein